MFFTDHSDSGTEDEQNASAKETYENVLETIESKDFLKKAYSLK